MEVINILDKDIALKLDTLGFKYNIQLINNKQVYTFIESPELMKILNSKFNKTSFFTSKYMNF